MYCIFFDIFTEINLNYLNLVTKSFVAVAESHSHHFDVLKGLPIRLLSMFNQNDYNSVVS